MKKIVLICFLILGFGLANAQLYFNTQFSILNQNQNTYQFQVSSLFTFGSGSNCPNLYPTSDQLQTDTIYIRQLYDFTGGWQQFMCIAVDTITFTNTYSSANYINLSVGYYEENMTQPNVIDTFWSVNDTTYPINPLLIIPSKNKEQEIQVFPNPATNTLHISSLRGTKQSIEMYNILGQLVYSTANQQLTTANSIDVSKLSKGVYYLKCNGESKKVLIE